MHYERTNKQDEAFDLLATKATDILLYGGSRSGKTHAFTEALIARACKCKSRHAILRQHFNHCKQTMWYDTIPKVMGIVYPGLEDRCTWSKSDWYIKLPNKSEIWIGGLDDKERTDKILGNEYCVDPESLILTTDLKWIKAKELYVGQEIIGFPEHLEGRTRLIRSIVQRSDIIQANKYKIKTSRGDTVVSENHKFVTKYDDGRGVNERTFSWRSVKELKVGDKLKFSCDTWSVDTSWNSGWLAGIFDGEGWISQERRLNRAAFADTEHLAVILSIEQIGVGDVVALGTSTKTFIADGFLGHNSSIYFVECSQMSEASVDVAKTRLAEKNILMKKAYYCCNPPKRSHWTYRKFIEQITDTGEKMKDWYQYKSILMNPYDNIKNIDSEYISNILDKLPPLLRQRFRDGLWVSDETDIFKVEWMLPCEVEKKDIAAKFTFIDPANTSKELATDSSCESAILTMGVTYEGHIMDVELLHGFWSYGELKSKAKYSFDMHSKCSNYTIGVEDVGSQKWLSTDLAEIGVTCSLVRPIADKVTRAISVTDLLEQGRVSVNDNYLRKQLLGFPGEKLKDCVDVFTYCLMMIKQMNLSYERSNDKYANMDGKTRMFWENWDKEREEKPKIDSEDFGL